MAKEIAPLKLRTARREFVRPTRTIGNVDTLAARKLAMLHSTDKSPGRYAKWVLRSSAREIRPRMAARF